MIRGTVSEDGVPTISLTIAGRDWLATIDTGFNGDLELPETLWALTNPRFAGPVQSSLAGGQTIKEDGYLIDFPFDGSMVRALTTFVKNENMILVGTHLLLGHKLEIDFPARTIRLERPL